MDNRPTIAEVQEWVLKLYNTCEQTITSEERKEQHKYAVMVQRPQDKKVPGEDAGRIFSNS